jgi:hypothetical protein
MSLPSEVNPHLLSSSGGYQISRSLRFRASATAYLSRTYGVATNNQKGTISVWLKQGLLNQRNTIFANSAGSIGVLIGATAGACNLQLLGSGLAGNGTTQVFRDPGAWFHLVIAVDTTQATGSNRIKAYINNTAITLPDTATQNAAFFTDSITYRIGSYANSSGFYYDGYMAEFYFVDGQQLTPSSFGATDASTGVWNPIKYTGTYGNNGSYLKFSDNTSPPSATTIGKDSSGNGNNWTPTGISLTTGTTYDSMVDTPTPYGVDTGLGGEVRGNYCTLSQINKYSSVDLQDAGLRYTTSQTGLNILAMGTMSVSSGKWYWEMTCTTAGAGDNGTIGIMRVTFNGMQGGTYLGFETNSVGYHRDGGKSVNGTYTPGYGASYNDGDVIGVAVDCTAGTIQYYKNGTSQGVISAGINYEWTPGVNAYNVTGTDPVRDLNFGQRPFVYNNPGVNRPSADYKCLCTQNLPTSTITNGANHMAATTYTGTGASLTVSNAVNGVSFQPDFVWVKSRSAATSHKLTDSVRGVTKGLISNTTGAETTDTNGLTAFGSSGFTVGSDTTYNNSGATYVGWQWKAGGTAVTNTNGSISSQVSANPTAGFSVLTYTGTGATATIGHGLGVAPSMMIMKKRSAVGSWKVFHTILGNGKILELNATDGAQTSSTYWNDTSANSTVFTVGSNADINASSETYVSYCFAAISGYSAFTTYTGNGSGDGPVVYLGFRPRFVMLKRSDSAQNWYILDAARNTYNGVGTRLYPNLSNADDNGWTVVMDFLSNGFKLKEGSDQNHNASGGTYIYAAFAENPFSIARAR